MSKTADKRNEHDKVHVHAYKLDSRTHARIRVLKESVSTRIAKKFTNLLSPALLSPTLYQVDRAIAIAAEDPPDGPYKLLA